MAVGTKCPEITRVVISMIAVGVINIQLASVLRNESAFLAGLFFVKTIWLA